MRIVDLRQVKARQLEPLFELEHLRWLEDLHWDYRPSLQLIKKFIEARSLHGFAALEEERAVGYCFYVVEEQKGLIGSLFVAPRYVPSDAGGRLLGKTVETLRGQARLERIEAQLMPFCGALDGTLARLGFALYEREFMHLPLESGVRPPELRLETWQDRWFQPAARLIQTAYAYHVDSEINDQYRSEAGALRFLKNIILLPGCGRFLPEASFLLREESSDRLAAMVLNSEVSPGVAHTTQIAVLPGRQGRGLGRALMQATVAALAARRFHALTLSVTSRNVPAITLYRQLGFATIKTFAAAVWQEAVTR